MQLSFCFVLFASSFLFGHHCCCLFVGEKVGLFFVLGTCLKLEEEKTYWLIDGSFLRANILKLNKLAHYALVGVRESRL